MRAAGRDAQRRGVFGRQGVLEGLLAGIILLLHLPVVFSHENYLLTWFNIDDGFYFFVVARNLAAGQGFTFDGLQASNGFQPLWLFLLAPIFWLPGKILPLRVVALLSILLSAGTAVLVYRLCRPYLSRGIAFLAALAFALLPPVHAFTVRGGMEAGLNAFLMALLLYRFQRVNVASSRSLLILGLAAGLAFLARLDNIFLAGFLGVWLLFKKRNGLSNWRRFTKDGFKQSAFYFSPLVLILALYIAWNWFGFGTLTPVSGQVKQWWGTLDNAIYGFPPRRLANYIGQLVTDDPNIGPFSLLTAPLYRGAESLFGESVAERRIGLAVIGSAAAVLLALVAWKNRSWMAGAGARLGIVPLFLGAVFQIGYYKLSGSVAQRPWYWVQEELALLLVGGMVLEAVWRLMRVENRGSQIAVHFAIVVLSIYIVFPHTDRIGRIFSSSILDQESFYLRRAAWIEANTESGARIGMTGSGSSGYFTQDRRIVNLDGLISSPAYLDALQGGTAHEYLAALGLDYVFGNTYILTESEPYGEIFSGRLMETAVFEDGDKLLQLWRFAPE